METGLGRGAGLHFDGKRLCYLGIISQCMTSLVKAHDFVVRDPDGETQRLQPEPAARVRRKHAVSA